LKKVNEQRCLPVNFDFAKSGQASDVETPPSVIESSSLQPSSWKRPDGWKRTVQNDPAGEKWRGEKMMVFHRGNFLMPAKIPNGGDSVRLFTFC